MGPGGAETQSTRAARVARDDAADRARVARCEVQAGVLPGRPACRLQRGERRPGADRDLAERLVDLADCVQPGQRQQHLAAARYARADEAGVAALRHDRRAEVGADAQDLGDLGGVGRANDDRGGSPEAAGPVALVRRAELRVLERMALADDVRERLSQVHDADDATPDLPLSIVRPGPLPDGSSFWEN